MKFIRFKQPSGRWIAVNPSLIVAVREMDIFYDGDEEKVTILYCNDGNYAEVTENIDTVLIRINDAL